MTVTERIAYLKGLYEGLGIDGEKKEGKVLKGVLDTLEDMAGTIADLEARNAGLIDELDDIYEELSVVQENLLTHDPSLEIDAEDEDEDLYQVVCPTCGETIYIDEDTLEQGSIQCHACGESLEFDLSALDESWENFDLDLEEAFQETEDAENASEETL